MFHLALYQPEIPPNTGNIIRLCANSGAALHLIQPYGFQLSDKHLKRAGLDYHGMTFLHEYLDYQNFKNEMSGKRIFAISTKGHQHYHEVEFASDDVFLFGPESRGLPSEILSTFPEENILRIPMLPNSRSLNLSNAVAVVLYEALRQKQFESLR